MVPPAAPMHPLEHVDRLEAVLLVVLAEGAGRDALDFEPAGKLGAVALRTAHGLIEAPGAREAALAGVVIHHERQQQDAEGSQQQGYAFPHHVYLTYLSRI